jgi:hypothetical protein
VATPQGLPRPSLRLGVLRPQPKPGRQVVRDDRLRISRKGARVSGASARGEKEGAVNGRDCWSEWLLRRRFGGDAEVERLAMERLRATRDRVLDQALLREGETLLDVGCGDGLIALGALERGARDLQRRLARLACGKPPPGGRAGCPRPLSVRVCARRRTRAGREQLRRRRHDPLGADLRRAQGWRVSGVPPRSPRSRSGASSARRSMVPGAGARERGCGSCFYSCCSRRRSR